MYDYTGEKHFLFIIKTVKSNKFCDADYEYGNKKIEY